MQVLILDQDEVNRLLPMEGCMDAMRDALAALARGDALMPLRTIVWLPDHSGGLAAMPSVLPAAGALGIKVITVFPGNLGTEFDSHQGAVLLFEGGHGRLLAIMDATEITAIRTAAVSGVATQLLARRDAGDLAILGSGTQARTHLEAMLVARPIRRVRVWSRTRERADTFVWLDLPLHVSLRRIWRRTWGRILRREELWAGNRERIWTVFVMRDSLVHWAVKSHFRQRREFPELLERHAHLEVVRLRSPRDVQRWLGSL